MTSDVLKLRWSVCARVCVGGLGRPCFAIVRCSSVSCLPPGQPSSSWSVWTQHERVSRGDGSQNGVCYFKTWNNSISVMCRWKLRSSGGCLDRHPSSRLLLFCIFSDIRCLLSTLASWLLFSQRRTRTPPRPTCLLPACVRLKWEMLWIFASRAASCQLKKGANLTFPKWDC